MKIYTVIVTYNGSKWIEKCLNSLIQSSLSTEIIVIDNASSDETVSIIKKKFPSLNIYESNKNLGFGQANNIGMRQALDENADYVFLLNQDAFVERDTIEELVSVHKANPCFAILSPVHLNGNGTQIDFAFENYTGKNYVSDSFLSDLFLNNVKRIYASQFINAACWLLPIQTVRKIGGFDPIFFHYGEDVNYCQRVNFHGFKIGFVPSSRIYHDREERVVDKGDYIFQLRQSIIYLTDVHNLSFWKVYSKDIFIKIKKAIKYLLILDGTNFVNYIKLICFLVKNTKRITESYIRNKIKQSNWL